MYTRTPSMNARRRQTHTHTVSCTKVTMKPCWIALLCNSRERQNCEEKLQVSGFRSSILLFLIQYVCVSPHMQAAAARAMCSLNNKQKQSQCSRGAVWYIYWREKWEPKRDTKEVSDSIRSDSKAIKVIIYLFVQSIKSVMRWSLGCLRRGELSNQPLNHGGCFLLFHRRSYLKNYIFLIYE